MVEAYDAMNMFTGPSNYDLATTIMFTDDPIVAGSTVVEAPIRGWLPERP